MKNIEFNSSSKILGFGEVMLRLTSPMYKKIAQSDYFDATYSGAEANVICSLSILGHDTKFITKVPNNPLGDKVVKDIRSFGVDTSHILKGDGRLGIYFLEQGCGVRNSEVIYDRNYSCISMAKKSDFDLDLILNDVKLLHISGITPALSKNMCEFTIHLIKETKKRNIIISYDSNYRSKLWSLDEAREFLLKVLPLVDICSLGILDFKNIMKYEVDESKEFDEQLRYCYSKICKDYKNIKFLSCTRRFVNSVNNNSIEGYLYANDDLYKSKNYTFDILDRVGGGDSYTAGILHGILRKLSYDKIVEFATCATVLKHSIYGDINLVSESDIQEFMNLGIGNIRR